MTPFTIPGTCCAPVIGGGGIDGEGVPVFIPCVAETGGCIMPECDGGVIDAVENGGGGCPPIVCGAGPRCGKPVGGGGPTPGGPGGLIAPPGGGGNLCPCAPGIGGGIPPVCGAGAGTVRLNRSPLGPVGGPCEFVGGAGGIPPGPYGCGGKPIGACLPRNCGGIIGGTPENTEKLNGYSQNNVVCKQLSPCDVMTSFREYVMSQCRMP